MAVYRQRRGTTPQMVGRYPDFDILESAHLWDEATRRVVLHRLNPPRSLRFFSDAEAPTAQALCDTVTAQDSEPRIPVLQLLDECLADGRLDGFEYADMPGDPETWHLVLRGLDEAARSRYGRETLAACDREARHAIVVALAAGQLAGGVWDELNIDHAWKVVVRMIVAQFYAHPWAWNEIGFGGPAYPRGYMRLGEGRMSREPFERGEGPQPDVPAWMR